MHSLTPGYLDGLQFSALQLETLNRIGEYQGKQALYADRLPEVLKTMRRIAQVESAESSNRIEGIRASRKRIQGIVIEHTTPDNRSEQEIAGYRDVLALIRDSATDMDMTANVIRQLHTVMYRYLPQPGGNWKMVDNKIVERDPVPTGKTVIVCVDDGSPPPIEVILSASPVRLRTGWVVVRLELRERSRADGARRAEYLSARPGPEPERSPDVTRRREQRQILRLRRESGRLHDSCPQ